MSQAEPTGGWEQMSGAIRQEMEAWHLAHPQASLLEIEQAVDAHLARLRTQLVGETVERRAVSAGAPVAETGQLCCPRCGGGTHPVGKRKRRLRLAHDQVLEFERSYQFCPTCQVGFFPPG